MKVIIKIYSVFSALSFLTFFNLPVHAALQTVQPPKPPVNIQDATVVNLQSGTATYNYPIQVPPATNGLAPKVSLNYSSSASTEAFNPVGSGWRLSRDYIERDAFFTPNSTNDDRVRLHFQGGVYDLLYVATENTYKSRVDNFMQLTRVASGGQGTTGVHWILKTKDGTSYRFGFNSNSLTMCNGRSYEDKWHLDLVTDTNSNKIFYTYTLNNGQAYLTNIKYNNDQLREVAFNYSTNPYSRKIYSQGCSLRTDLRLNNIQVKHSGNLVRQYDLAYGTATNGMSMLNTITMKGSDGSSIPPVAFTYHPQNSTWKTQHENWINNQTVDVTFLYNNVRLLDVNGDALPDIVKTPNYGGPDTEWIVFKNLGNSWKTTPEVWISRNAHIEINLNQRDVTFADANGDGLVDIVRSNNMGGPSNWWRVYKNLGNSWSTSPETWIPSSPAIDVNLIQTNVRLADVNGDSLPDIIKVNNYGGPDNEWVVYKNTGTNWRTTPEVWISRTAHIEIHPEQNNVTLSDANGDGLLDIVRSNNYGGPAQEWVVYKNTGSNWLVTPEVWLSRTFNAEVNLNQTDVTLADANGDGLPDIIRVVNWGGPNNEWRVHPNTGNGWSAQWQSWVSGVPLEANLQFNDVRLADANGDGYVDIIRVYSDGGPAYTWRVWLNNGNSTNLLSSVKNSEGGKINFEYTRASSFENTRLPFPMAVVKKVTKDNGMTGLHQTIDVSTYWYKNGLYVNNLDLREFRGFWEVYETLPTGNINHYLFNQDDAKKGTMSISQIMDSQYKVYFQTEYFYSSNSVNGVYNVLLQTEKNSTFDGIQANPKVVEINYQYDLYGNIIRKSELGDISLTGDEKFSYFEYVYNTAIYLVNRVNHSYVRSSNDVDKVYEDWFYYDNNLSFSDSPTKGNLTKQEKWNDRGSNILTLFEYNSFGNKTKETDANLNQTQFVYGITDTTNTFIEKIINPILHEIKYSYNFGTGNLLSEIDANNFETRYVYDTFGRKTQDIKPYDSEVYPTITYQYLVDGTAPEGVKVSQRLNSSEAPTLDVYTFTDGFSRTIQSRKPSQDSTKQIVSDTYYNSQGKVTKSSNPYYGLNSFTFAAPQQVASTVSTYDPVGRIVKKTNPDGTFVNTTYNRWLITLQDENNNFTRRQLDAYNRVSRVDEIVGESIFETKYTYDTLDNLTKITDNQNNIISYTFDSLKRKVGQSDPDTGATVYSYDGAGNLVSQIDNRNITTTIQYDTLNRIKTKRYGSDPVITYTYDQPIKGTLSQVVDSSGTTQYLYDLRLRKIKETKTINSISWNTEFTYDAADRIKVRKNPDGEILNHIYNNQGELEAIDDLINAYKYNEVGKVSERAMVNGLSTKYAYHPDSFRLTSIKTGNLQDLSYTYDNVGNIKSINNSLTSSTVNYSYDALNRLISAIKNGTNGYSQSFKYDSIGNLLELKTGEDVFKYTYGTNVLPHAIVSYETPLVPEFTNISAELLENTATFTFNYNVSSSGYTIHMSTLPDMSWDVYLSFATGSVSPIVETNPKKWDKYTCGRTFYYKVISSTGVESPINTAAVSCTTPPSQTNIAPLGTAYRWWKNTVATSNSNRVAAGGLNDNNLLVDVKLSTDIRDSQNAWEAAGVLWAENKTVTKVEYTNGSWDTTLLSGAFSANFKLQRTTDGLTWVDTGWTCTPSYPYDSPNTAGATYSCQGSSTLTVRGLRVTGQVRTKNAKSMFANAREIKAY